MADRLQAAASRINAIAGELMRAPTTVRLAARVDDTAGEVAALAASLAGLLGRGAPQPAVVDIAACVDEVVAGTDVDGVPVEAHLAPDQAGMEVFAVPTAIRLVLAILLDNATRAVRLAHERHAAEGRVFVSCAIDSSRMVVTVVDNGIGMAAPQRERAYQPPTRRYAKPSWRHASKTATDTAFERFRLRECGRMGIRSRRSAGKDASTSGDRPRLSGPKSSTSPAR